MEEKKISALVNDIIFIKPMFFQKFGKPVPVYSDITPGGYYAMLYLSKHHSLSMSDLGKILMISKPNVTALINKLIEKGLVVRLSDNQDRRIIMIRLSSMGVRFVEKNHVKYLEQVKQRLKSLTEELFSTSIQNIKDLLLKIPIPE